MLLSALRGSLWHLQMKQSQLHPQRRGQCNTGDIRNLIFKMYFVLYLFSQCPNILLSTAKLSFNWFSRDPNSNKTTIVPKANLSFCHQSQSLTFLGMQERGASPREEWDRHSLHMATCADGGTNDGFVPSLPLLLLVHHEQVLAWAHKRAAKHRCQSWGVPPFGKMKLGTATHQQWPNPEVSPCPYTLLKVQQSHDKNQQDTKVFGPCLNLNCLISSRNRIKRGGTQTFLLFLHLFLLF